MTYRPSVAIPNNDIPSSDRFDLILLHHWSFTSAESGMDFQKKMEQINSRVADSSSENYDAGDLIPLDRVPVEMQRMLALSRLNLRFLERNLSLE